MKFDTRALKNDINSYMKTFAQTYVDDAIRRVEEKANNYVAYFYDDFKPEVYQRTFQFLDNTVTSETWKNKDSYSGYVNLMSDVVNDKYIYGDPILTDYEIREENWNGGRFKGDSTNPSPLFYLMEFFNKRKFNNNAINKAKRIARKNEYSCIKQGIK